MKNAGAHDRDPHFVRAWAVKMHLDSSQKPFGPEFSGKMPGLTIATQTLCEPARGRDALQHCGRAISREHLQVNAADQLEHTDQAPAFTLTV